jgi:metallo-beta-lactamase family protein
MYTNLAPAGKGERPAAHLILDTDDAERVCGADLNRARTPRRGSGSEEGGGVSVMELEFSGAAGEVTGSMHVLHTPAGPLVLDCGLHQGRRAAARRLNESFPLEPGSVEAVVLSHAHIDHSGRLPALARRGFAGRIHGTSATSDLCRIMLPDSAHIQEEDARFWNEKRASNKSEFIEPLYTADDARLAIERLAAVDYNASFEPVEGVKAKFMEAGHILGSAVTVLELDGATLLYTGDLGRFNLPILRDPVNPLPRVDYLITESTYATRTHPDAAGMAAELVEVVNDTRKLGGKVVIPSFSVGRTQTIVYFIQQAFADGSLEGLPIYVDSPLSSGATEVFRNHPECYDAEARAFWRQEGDVFGDGLVTYITEVNDSKALNDVAEPCVIISASGMCEAGRILHHLKNNIEDEHNTVIIVGWQAEHTLGRRIVERHDEVRIFGRMYKLNCRVEAINGFSAHADADDFRRLLGPLAPGLKAAFVVHGEAKQLEAMKEILIDAGCADVRIPSPGDRFRL